jgi:hypothetical protein
MLIAFDLCWFGCRDENVTIGVKGKCWYPSPQFSLADDRSWWSAHGEKYVDALVGAFPAGTPGLLLWDVVNEPESGGAPVRWAFVTHFVACVTRSIPRAAPASPLRMLEVMSLPGTSAPSLKPQPPSEWAT